MTDKINLWLPPPVSVNSLYMNNKKYGRHKTKEARKWDAMAQYAILPFAKQYSDVIYHNLRIRDQYMDTPKKMDVQRMWKDHPKLSYHVTYGYAFQNNIGRDIFNFEKQLTDFLVNTGFMIDDMFIDDGRVTRLKHDKNNPHVNVEIISLDSRVR